MMKKINELLVAAQISEKSWFAAHTPSVSMEHNNELKQMFELLYTNLSKKLGVTNAWTDEEWELLLNRSSQRGYVSARLGEVYPLDLLQQSKTYPMG